MITSMDRMKNENSANCILIDFKLDSPGAEARAIIIDNLQGDLTQSRDH